ncbi:hypothetical protein [Bilophila wadsworthia]|uniref:hypothetical protein n=1 Tax=Bilophila wadsworthia TaxID=35833 RepID=UPI0026DD5616|nr:hypothetical protein [Bilophila wadsworthia]
MTVMQNGLMGETGLRRTMPHWPQPGLIPRDPARGDRLETIAYFGSDQYEPQFVKTGAFQDALRQRGVRFVNRFQGDGTITSMWMPCWQSVIALLLCWQPNRHPS